MNSIDLISFRGIAYRLLWQIVWGIFCRPIPQRLMMGWKREVLRLFGAQIASDATIYNTTKIYCPANLIMKSKAILGPHVDCYNVDKIEIGVNAMVSQGAYLCSASHDTSIIDGPLVTSPITIAKNSWVAADAFIGRGVTIGEGAVVAARAVVVKDVMPYTIVGGNPAKFLKERIIIK